MYYYCEYWDYYCTEKLKNMSKYKQVSPQLQPTFSERTEGFPLISSHQPKLTYPREYVKQAWPKSLQPIHKYLKQLRTSKQKYNFELLASKPHFGHSNRLDVRHTGLTYGKCVSETDQKQRRVSIVPVSNKEHTIKLELNM